MGAINSDEETQPPEEGRLRAQVEVYSQDWPSDKRRWPRNRLVPLSEGDSYKEIASICLRVSQPRTVVQEVKALSHAHMAQEAVYRLEHIELLLWPGNSPDLNMIEAAWPWLKRETTKKGAPIGRAEAEKKWLQIWKDLDQQRIQAWIERIPVHIQEVIKLNGGNC